MITSLTNSKIKQVVRLANSRSYRNTQQLAVIYGLHLIEEALKHGILHSLFASQKQVNMHAAVFNKIADNNNIYVVNEEVLSKINLADSAADIVGLIRIKHAQMDDLDYEQDCVVLENIQDPGNLGTIMRTCAAVGIRDVILCNSCVDPYNIKVLRASQGVQFGLNVINATDIDKFLQNYKYQVIATTPDATQTIYEHNLTRPCAWIFGNEGNGLSKSILHNVSCRLSIPMPGKIESLNVAMAATVCLFEMLRQRFKI